ncbi:uncharacterized protein LOC122510012 [Leptopilina heterotoma]|uniref:uncharacterized protein LOC122510012 n=1 Tax=Leptopilina heterotoma TaxID=63436 RepID=UPI001CA92B6B|nr:uncharacterized protein LOC122510012 [Leptopilina heterotoma]
MAGVYNLDVLRTALDLVSNSVDGLLAYLKTKYLAEEDKKIKSGVLGRGVFFSNWVNAASRVDPNGLWPCETALSESRNYDCEKAEWVQEYLWCWGERRYKVRYLWCPSDFLMPTVCNESEDELIEEIFGCLGVNVRTRSFSSLPVLPIVRGFRPKNPIFELVYVQRYRRDWEELILTYSGWELRWKLNVSSVWFSQ